MPFENSFMAGGSRTMMRLLSSLQMSSRMLPLVAYSTSLLLAGSLVAVSAQEPVPPNPGFPPCSICGEGMRISAPDVIVDIPTFGTTSCDNFEDAGLLGFIDPQFCGAPIVSNSAALCGCVPDDGGPRPTPFPPVPRPTPFPVQPPQPSTDAPVGPPTDAPVVPTTDAPVFTPPAWFVPTIPQEKPVPPNPGFPPCSICGEGMRISMPDVIVNIPTFGETTCENFQDAGLDGFIDAQFCGPIVTGLAAPCVCVPNDDGPKVQ